MTAASADASDGGIDPQRVTQWLAKHAGLTAPMAFRRIGGGQSNLTFEVKDASGRRTVLRRPPIGVALESAHDMEREFQITAGLHAAGQKVAEPLAMCDDPEVTGAPFYLMAHVEGRVLLSDSDAEALDHLARERAGLLMMDTLADLQRVDLVAAGLGELRRNTPYIARQIRRWQGQWAASRTRELPEVDALADQLSRAAPETDADVLVHGDYRLDNLLFDDDGSVTAVLDWELCTTGPPLADLGLALAYWEEASHPDGVLMTCATALPGFPTPDELVARYAHATGRDTDGVAYYVALAFWKIAIIVEGVHRRWLTDPANGAARAGELGAMVPRLVTRASEAASHAGL